MKHFYIIAGNEYGVDIDTKVNFLEYDDAIDEFTKLVDAGEYSGYMLVYVNSNGMEDIQSQIIND